MKIIPLMLTPHYLFRFAGGIVFLGKTDFRYNLYKFYYKSYRFLTIFLGAVVTLTSSLAATTFVDGIPWLDTGLDFAVPIIAAFLTIITGLSQNFQWGSAWRNMMVNKQRLEGERDRFLATEPRKRNYRKELEILNSLVLAETESFFQRVLDSEAHPSKMPQLEGTDRV